MYANIPFSVICDYVSEIVNIWKCRMFLVNESSLNGLLNTLYCHIIPFFFLKRAVITMLRGSSDINS